MDSRRGVVRKHVKKVDNTVTGSGLRPSHDYPNRPVETVTSTPDQGPTLGMLTGLSEEKNHNNGPRWGPGREAVRTKKLAHKQADEDLGGVDSYIYMPANHVTPVTKDVRCLTTTGDHEETIMDGSLGANGQGKGDTVVGVAPRFEPVWPVSGMVGRRVC
jgi:hypothetical protein